MTTMLILLQHQFTHSVCVSNLHGAHKSNTLHCLVHTEPDILQDSRFWASPGRPLGTVCTLYSEGGSACGCRQEKVRTGERDPSQESNRTTRHQSFWDLLEEDWLLGQGWGLRSTFLARFIAVRRQGSFHTLEQGGSPGGWDSLIWHKVCVVCVCVIYLHFETSVSWDLLKRKQP